MVLNLRCAKNITLTRYNARGRCLSLIYLLPVTSGLIEVHEFQVGGVSWSLSDGHGLSELTMAGGRYQERHKTTSVLDWF